MPWDRPPVCPIDFSGRQQLGPDRPEVYPTWCAVITGTAATGQEKAGAPPAGFTSFIPRLGNVGNVGKDILHSPPSLLTMPAPCTMNRLRKLPGWGALHEGVRRPNPATHVAGSHHREKAS